MGAVCATDHPEVQWQLARLVSRLELDESERSEALDLMVRMFDESPVGIVKVNALQAVLELSRGRKGEAELVDRCLERALGSSSAVVRSGALRLVSSAHHGQETSLAG